MDYGYLPEIDKLPKLLSGISVDFNQPASQPEKSRFGKGLLKSVFGREVETRQEERKEDGYYIEKTFPFTVIEPVNLARWNWNDFFYFEVSEGGSLRLRLKEEKSTLFSMDNPYAGLQSLRMEDDEKYFSSHGQYNSQQRQFYVELIAFLRNLPLKERVLQYFYLSALSSIEEDDHCNDGFNDMERHLLYKAAREAYFPTWFYYSQGNAIRARECIVDHTLKDLRQVLTDGNGNFLDESGNILKENNKEEAERKLLARLRTIQQEQADEVLKRLHESSYFNEYEEWKSKPSFYLPIQDNVEPITSFLLQLYIKSPEYREFNREVPENEMPVKRLAINSFYFNLRKFYACDELPPPMTYRGDDIKDLLAEYCWKHELNELIGLDGVKKEVRRLAAFARTQVERKAFGLTGSPVSLHMIFTGNPGTGKTTVARIVSDIYTSLGLIKQGQLVEVDRQSLVGQYVGETAIKTQKKIDEALGGVLFVDEAYTLAKGGNDFGGEAIETIMKAMEDNRDNLVVILAGYPKEMNDFLQTNPGLSSRFNRTIHFEDYSNEELVKVFNLICENQNFFVDADEGEALKVLSEYFDGLRNIPGRAFGNARDARNTFEDVIQNQAMRLAEETEQGIQHDREDYMKLKIEDFPSVKQMGRVIGL